jgi:hypothetical protein
MVQTNTRKGLERALAELNAVRNQPDTAEARALLQSALESTRSPLVAAAAHVIGEAELSGFEPALVAAFERFFGAAEGKADPGCTAKTGTVRALYRLGASAHEVYLRGIRCVQKDPGWGGAEDSAVELRGLSALALVRSGYHDALLEVAELMADPVPMARLHAVQAVAYSERTDVGIPLLRFKARLGDADARVTAACLAGLLGLAESSSLEFVASFLERGSIDSREAALIALGESRLPAALPLLQRAAESPLHSELRSSVFIAISLLRSDAAWDYLLRVVRESSKAHAQAAIAALSSYRGLANLRERTMAAVHDRAEAPLVAEAERLFSR